MSTQKKRDQEKEKEAKTIKKRRRREKQRQVEKEKGIIDSMKQQVRKETGSERKAKEMYWRYRKERY